MNIKRDPLTDNEEETTTARRTKRPKKFINWSFLKPSRKKRKKPDESKKDDGISIDLRQETISTNLEVKQEKLPAVDFQLVKGVQHEDFNVGRSHFSCDGRYGVTRVDKLDVDRSSESTLSACSDSDCSNLDDCGVIQDHSYAASPSKKKKKRLEPKKKIVETETVDLPVEMPPRPTVYLPAEMARRPTVDLPTLAVYRALIDHTYSSISPSNLIDAVMLKHHYICSIQHIEDVNLKTGYIREQPHCDSKTKPECDSRLDPRSHSKRDTIFIKKGRRPKKDVSPPKGRKDLPEDPSSELEPIESLAENPKFRRKNESPKRSPRIKLEKRETSPISPKVPAKKVGKSLTKKINNISPTKKVEVDEKLDSSSLSSKPEEQTKKLKKRRRRNQTGWPTKYKPQPNKSKTSIDKTKTKNLKSSSPKKGAKIKKAASTFRDSSPDERLWKNIKMKKNDALNSSGGVNVSIEEAVKRRHQCFNEPKKGIGLTSPEKKVREKRKVKSVYQRSEDGSSQLNKHEEDTSKRTGRKPKASLKTKLASFIKKETLSSDERDAISEPDANSGNKNVSSSGSQSRSTRQKTCTPIRNRLSKSLERSPRKATPSKTRGTKNEVSVLGDDLPASDLNDSSSVVEDVNCEKTDTDPGVDRLPSMCESPSKTIPGNGNDNERKDLSKTNDTVTSHITEAGQSEKVNSNEVVSLQGENATTDPHSSPKRLPPPSPVRDSETRNRSHGLQTRSIASSPKNSVVSPARNKATVSGSVGSPSPSAEKSIVSTQEKTEDGISSRSPVSRTRRRSKNEDSKCTSCSPATPSMKSGVSTPSRKKTEPSSSSPSTNKTMPEKSRSATPRRSKAGASARSPVSEKKKIDKHTPTSQHSATNRPHTSPLKIKDIKSETEGTDNPVPTGGDASLDDTAGSLVPNPKARMSLRKRVRHQVASLFKPRCSSRSKTSQSQPPKLAKIKQEVVDGDYELSGSNNNALTDTQGGSIHQPQTIPAKTKRRQKKLFWGHRKPRSKGESTVKLSPVKGKSYEKNCDTSSGIFPDNKKDEIVENPPEVDDEERRAELGLAIIKVETMESDFMLEHPVWGQESCTVDDGGCTTTSNHDCGKSESPLQDSKGNYSKSVLKDLMCTEEFSYDNDSSRCVDVVDDRDVRMMEPEVVYPPLETLDYTGWRNTKTIYTTDVSDSGSEDGYSIPEAEGSCRDPSSSDCDEPRSFFQSHSPIKCEPLVSIPGEEDDAVSTRVMGVEPDHLKLESSTFRDDSSTNNPEEDYPLTSRVRHVIGCRSSNTTCQPDPVIAVLEEPCHPKREKPIFEDEGISSGDPNEKEGDPLMSRVERVIGCPSSNTICQPDARIAVFGEPCHPKPEKPMFEDEGNSSFDPNEAEGDPLMPRVVRVIGCHSSDTTCQPGTGAALLMELGDPKPANSAFEDEWNSCSNPEPEEDPLTLGVVCGCRSNDTTNQPKTGTAVHPETVETLAKHEPAHSKPALVDGRSLSSEPVEEEDPLTSRVVCAIGCRSIDTTCQPGTKAEVLVEPDQPKPAKPSFEVDMNSSSNSEEGSLTPSLMQMIGCCICDTTCRSRTRTDVLVEPDQRKPAKPTFEDDMNSSSDDGLELEDDPTSTVLLDVQTDWDARIKNRRDTMRKLKQRQRRYRQKWKRLRAKRKFSIIRRQAAVARFLPDAIGMGSAGKRGEFDSPSKSASDEPFYLHQLPHTPSEDDPLCDGSEFLRVVDVTKTPADIETRGDEKSGPISTSKSAREKYSPHQRSLTPSEDDPLCDRPDSLRVVDITMTSADIQTHGGKSRRISTSKSAREKYSPHQRSLSPSEDDPLCDESLRVVDVTNTPADMQTHAGEKSRRLSTSKSAREKNSLHQLSLTSSEDDPLCDRAESLRVVDVSNTPADIQTHAGEKTRRLSTSKSAKEKYSLLQGLLTPSEDDPLCHRPESLSVVDLTMTPADIHTCVGEKSRRIPREIPSILRQRPVENEVKKPQMKNKKADEPLRVMSMNEEGELCPLLPKLVSPQPCFETPQEGISKDLMNPALPECEPPQPCTVGVVSWHVLDGGSPSTSTDAQKVQNQEVAEMRPMFPSMSEGKMQKLGEDDTLPGVSNRASHVEGIRKLENVRQYPPAFKKAAYTTAAETVLNRANHPAVEGFRKLGHAKQHPPVFLKDAYTTVTETDLKGICKMDTVGTRITTMREKARRVSLQINDEHAYCRKGWTNDIARNRNDFVDNVRICDEHESYIVTEQNNFVSDRLTTKNLPVVTKQKPVTVTVPKTHFLDGVRSRNGQSFEPNSHDPYDLSGIVAPLPNLSRKVAPLPPPDPDAVKKTTIRSYAPGSNFGRRGPLIPNIGEDGKAVSKGGTQDEMEPARYQPSPEIARLDVLVRKRFKLPGGQVSYNLRKDGRPPFSYQTMAAMAIESDPLMAAKASDVLDFVQEHFPFYRKLKTRWWKHTLRSLLSSSKVFRGDKIGRNVYYSFCKELRLPGDPAICEITEEPFEKSDESEEDEDEHDDFNKQSDESPESSACHPFGDLQEPSEPDPLVPICSYSDGESDDFPVIVDAVTYTGDKLPANTESEEDDQYDCDTEIKEEPDEGIDCEDPSTDMESTSLSTNGERVYACSYCPAVFDTLQGNLDHSIIHPEVMKPCPLCNFSSPDNVQLLWHVNSAHSNHCPD